MSQAAETFADRVPDHLVRVWDAVVDCHVVCMDHCVEIRDVVRVALRLSLVSGRDDLRSDLVVRPILRADNGGHVPDAATFSPPAFGVRPVPTLTVHVRLVDFLRAVRQSVASITFPRFSNLVHHEPCAELADAKVAAQPYARNQHRDADAKVDGAGPLAHSYAEPGHRHIGVDSEPGPALGTPLEHGIGVRNPAGADASAPAAGQLVIQTDALLEPLVGHSVRGKHVLHPGDGESFPAGLSRDWLRHCESVLELRRGTRVPSIHDCVCQ